MYASALQNPEMGAVEKVSACQVFLDCPTAEKFVAVMLFLSENLY